MYGNYDEIVGSDQFMDEFLTSLTASLGSSLFSYALSIAAYVFLAIGMYTIAKRRNIRHAWLAWIPFGSTWLLGSISDQYRYVTLHQQKSKRKVMLGLEIAVSVVGVAAIVLIFAALINMMGNVLPGLDMDEAVGFDETAMMTELMAPLMISVVLCLVMMGLAIALAVLQYMALYDLYKSCAPGNATLFTVLSIFFGSFVQALLVFSVRKKDEGMIMPQSPVYTPPAFQPQPNEWQPQQPPVEPWTQNDNNF